MIFENFVKMSSVKHGDYLLTWYRYPLHWGIAWVDMPFGSCSLSRISQVPQAEFQQFWTFQTFYETLQTLEVSMHWHYQCFSVKNAFYPSWSFKGQGETNAWYCSKEMYNNINFTENIYGLEMLWLVSPDLIWY